MTFSVHGFLRQVPVERVKDYFESRNVPVPARWWSEKGLKLATRLSDHLLAGDDHAGGSILAELGRAHVMAGERGRTALINASFNRSEITEAFAKLENDADRAVWMLTSHKSRTGEGALPLGGLAAGVMRKSVGFAGHQDPAQSAPQARSKFSRICSSSAE